MTLEIKAGGWYWTRSGHKAFVGYRHEHDRYPWVGHIEGDAACAAWCWDGRYSMHADNVCDLVAEWEDEPEPEPLEPGNYLVKTSSGFHHIIVVRTVYGSSYWRYAGSSTLFPFESGELDGSVRLLD